MAFMFLNETSKENKFYRKKEEKFNFLQKSFSQAEIEAKAFYVYDLTEQKEIYGKNANEILPLASLAKTMTAFISLKNSEDEEIKISPLAIKEEGDYGFSIGEKFNKKELVKLTLLGSINDSAFALIENIDNYLEKMNLMAKKFNLDTLLFLNATGLDLSKEKASAFGSAQEINFLNIYFQSKYPEISKATTLAEIKIKSNLGKIYTLKNTNLIIDKIPNPIFSKTGYTEIAGGNLSIIFINKANHKIAITLLGSSRNGRFSDMEKLVNLSYTIGNE